MSVIITISATSDCMVSNGTFTVLKNLAIPHLINLDDQRALEMARAVHGLDLAEMEPSQAKRLSWAIDDALSEKIRDYAGEGSEDGVSFLTSIQSLLRAVYGSPHGSPVADDPPGTPTS
jgi:hypothetical protein